MKQIVISILKTIFKIIKAVLCVAGVMAVILSLEVTKNIIKDKENGDTNDSQEISIEVSGKIPVQQVEQENDNNKQHYATLQEASQHTEVFTEEGGEYDTQIEHIIAVFENSKEVIAAYQSAKSPKQMHVYEELAHFQISKEDEKRVKGMGFLNNRGTDLFSARVLTTNGKVTAAQHRCMADAAEKFGNGELLYTTRLSVEIPGIPYDKIEEFQKFIAKEGLVTGGTGAKVRPVVSCKGTTCQYGLLDSYAVSEEIYRRFYEGYREVALPHKFKIAVGGCPNNCVKPDLNDVGIIGQRIPNVNADVCKGCKKCAIEAACPNKVAKVVDGKIQIDKNICKNCGRCVGKCPFHTIEDGAYGYKIYIGGRWGKKVSQGKALGRIFTSKEEALDVIEKAILFFRDNGIKGERFAETIERIGFENVEKQLLEQL